VSGAADQRVRAFAPGRVNLIGDHTDHTGGLCLPTALSMGVAVDGERLGDAVVLDSDRLPGTAVVPLDVTHPSDAEPPWARYVAGVVAELRPAVGLRGHISSDVPVGAGLSSSAALEVAVALAVGFDGPAAELASACRNAEEIATGVPCGVLDQMASAAGVDGHALLLDCHTSSVHPVPVPEGIEFVVVHSGQSRSLAGSAYAERRLQCEAAEAIVGPLRLASVGDVESIADPVLRRRARHVVTENQRVRETVTALSSGDARRVGSLFSASHRSLRQDFESSTATVDATVERLCTIPGVHGARMTGGGWGGCVVAATEPGVLDEGWTVRPGAGAHVSGAGAPSGWRTRPRI
jgi:galactokinase